MNRAAASSGVATNRFASAAKPIADPRAKAGGTHARLDQTRSPARRFKNGATRKVSKDE